ncbi:MAG: transporter substrate-binding domain-containing protein, partial [Aromatoleum sp.]|nr:transporter substrate-binding domain-containing protein [Aromatoleum sp.]
MPWIALGLLALLSACTTIPATPSIVLADLAPKGKLRAAINFGNPILATKDASGGEPRGVSVDLARELARRLRVPVEFVTYDTAGKVVDGLKADAWDVAFLAIDPARAVDIAYSAAYAVIEGAYLVPEASPIRSNADVDRDGVRVAVGAGSTYDLYLTRQLAHATIVRVAT